MKKILALVLAVMMLSSLAFAAAVRIDPGEKVKFAITLDPADGTVTLVDADTAVTANVVGPKWDTKVELVTKNLTLSSIKWTKGSNYVKSLTIDDNQVVLELKQDYKLQVSTTNPRIIGGEFKLAQKGKGNTITVTLPTTGGTWIETGYLTQKVDFDGTALVATAPSTIAAALGRPGYIFRFGKPATGTNSYNTFNFGDDMGNDVEVRIYDGENYYLESTVDPDLAIVKKYDDTGADLTFISWPGTPTFNATATYYIYAEEDEFVYAIKNGAVVASGAKWSDDDGCWILKTRTLGAYVISDIKLTTTTASTANPNPDTGANDVVGIATAMAVVALVSAAAVSLKK